jgi:hypothetical protein
MRIEGGKTCKLVYVTVTGTTKYPVSVSSYYMVIIVLFYFAYSCFLLYRGLN